MIPKICLTLVLLSLGLFIGTYAADYKLVWSDEFNGNAINESNWKFDMDCLGGGNNELQCYTKRKENAYTKDGYLVIHSIPEEYDEHHYTSSRLHLRHTGWTYGKFEAKARMPKGKHLWPAIWLYPQESLFGTWAASGEIDIMEFRGERVNETQFSIHYGGYWPHNAYSGSSEIQFAVDFTADFHVFTFEWNENEMLWFVDGKQYHRENMKRSFYSGKGPNPYTKDGEPFNQNFQWIINTAIGGGFFPAEKFGSLTVEEAKQWPKPLFEIDYVRVYQTDAQIKSNPVTESPGGSTTSPVVTTPTSSTVTVKSTTTHATTTTTHATTTTVKTTGQSVLDANDCCPAYTGKVCNFDAQHNCVADEMGKVVLCGLNAGACNGQCFDNVMYRCVNSKLEHV